MAATMRTVDARDLTTGRIAQVGEIWGRHEYSNSEGVVRDQWQPAKRTDSIDHGWGESWNNMCSTTGPRALYEVVRVIEDLVLTFVELKCIKSKTQ